MKFAALVISSLLLLSGCGSSAPDSPAPVRPYQVFDTKEGSAQITLRVQVPAGSTNSQLEAWSKELAALNTKLNTDSNKDLMVNFYEGARDITGFRGTYQGDTFYDTRIKK